MAQIDNRVVIDSEWEALEANMMPLEELKGAGYTELGTGAFVPKEKAYKYALEQCLGGTEKEQKEFQEMLVEWFYSGNWIKED